MRNACLKHIFGLIRLFSSLLMIFWGWSGLCSSPKQLQETYAGVAEKALPAVVTVYSLQSVGSSFRTHSLGSGFLVSPDGFIVTNFHVIAEADALAVKLASKKVIRARIVGTSRAVDLAVLKIEGKEKFPFLTFSDTRNVKVGHYAIAIGSPFSLAQTVTVGIVSHKGRELGLHYREDYIQTDASINPGNSGGPLLDIDGNVIGVNDCIISPKRYAGTRGSVGIGFAIDGNLASRVVKNIIRTATAPKAFAGILMRDDDKVNLPVIIKVVAGSPADRAGLAVGDQILQMDSKSFSSAQEVQSAILKNYAPGDKASFVVRRNGKLIKKTVQFTLRR